MPTEKTHRYVQSKMPTVRGEFDRLTHEGKHPSEIVGLICDGTRQMKKMGTHATVIPIEVARRMFGAVASELRAEMPEFDQIAATVHSPPPGVFVTLFFVGDELGVVGHYYEQFTVNANTAGERN